MQRWAVPCFFMITGALLLNKEKDVDVKQSLVYSRRIVLAIVIFGTIYSLIEQIITNSSFSIQFIVNALWSAICNKSWGHLWYLYVCLGIYLAIPVLKLMVNGLGTRSLWYLVGILSLATFIIPVCNEQFGCSIAFEFPIGTYAVTYLVLGKLLNEEPPKVLCKQWINVLIVVVVTFIIACATLTNHRDKLLFDMNFSPIVAVYSIAIFMFFRNSSGWLKSSKYMWRLDRLCFGIYIIHPIFIHFSYRFLRLTPVRFKMYGFALVVFWVCTFCLSALTTYLMKRIPLINKYLL